MKKGIPTIIIAASAILIGIYPVIYFIVDRKFGLLSSKSDGLLSDVFWNVSFYIHIVFGGLALMIGWTQFVSKWRTAKLNWHRRIGKLYVIMVLLSALAGIHIAFHATGGFIASLGFICLGIIWFYTTLKAFLLIKEGKVDHHQRMMIYSYAACFAAVTLRIWLPLLTLAFHDFVKAYLIVAWMCWVPNMIVAYFIVRRLGRVNIAV
jgi:Predicted membrane protein (DUF2306)